jgi:hypothetical protein
VSSGPDKSALAVPACAMAGVVNINDVLAGHVSLEVECVDRLYLFSALLQVGSRRAGCPRSAFGVGGARAADPGCPVRDRPPRPRILSFASQRALLTDPRRPPSIDPQDDYPTVSTVSGLTAGTFTSSRTALYGDSLEAARASRYRNHSPQELAQKGQRGTASCMRSRSFAL